MYKKKLSYKGQHLGFHCKLFQTDSVLRNESRMAEDGGNVVYYCLVLLVLGVSLVQVCPQSPAQSRAGVSHLF